MSKKSELQEQVEALGIDPTGMTIADMESLLAEQVTKSETPEAPTEEPGQPTEATKEGGEQPKAPEAPETPGSENPTEKLSETEVTDAEEVKPEAVPAKKSFFDKKELSFEQKIEECMQKCADFLNKGGDVMEMRKYLKELAYY